jgi:hypothetical protein
LAEGTGLGTGSSSGAAAAAVRVKLSVLLPKKWWIEMCTSASAESGGVGLNAQMMSCMPSGGACKSQVTKIRENHQMHTPTRKTKYDEYIKAHEAQ